MSSSLKQWGWSPELEQHMQEIARADKTGLVPGRVARQDRTGYLVVHEGGDAFARTTSRLRDGPPAVGDRVALDLGVPETIRALLPRRTAFTRAAARRAGRSSRRTSTCSCSSPGSTAT